MDAGPGSPATGLLYALKTQNEALIDQLLAEESLAMEDGRPISVHIDDLLDFLDRLPLAKLSAPQLYKEKCVSSLCALVHASDPQMLRERSAILLSYLIDALDLSLPQLSSSLWLLWLADRSTAEQALREHGLTNRRPQVRACALRELGKWVDAMKGKIAFKKFTPAVVKLLRDEHSGVRQAAYTLIVNFFSGAKQPAREDLFEVMKKLQFNEALQNKIRSAISDEPVPIAPTAPVARPASRPASPVTLELECVTDPFYAMQKLPAKSVRSVDEFLAELGSGARYFEGKETEHNWSARQNAVHNYRQLIRSDGLPRFAIKEGFKIVSRGFSEVLLSMRTTLVIETCQAIKDTAQLLGESAEVLDSMLEPLTKVASGVKKITASAAHITICCILVESPQISARQFQYIAQESRNLKPHARAYAFEWLRVALQTSTFGPAPLARQQVDVESLVLRAVSDAAPTGRVQGRELFFVLQSVWPEAAQNIVAKLPSSALKALQSSKKFRSPQLSVAVTRSPSPTNSPVSSPTSVYNSAPGSATNGNTGSTTNGNTGSATNVSATTNVSSLPTSSTTQGSTNTGIVNTTNGNTGSAGSNLPTSSPRLGSQIPARTPLRKRPVSPVNTPPSPQPEELAQSMADLSMREGSDDDVFLDPEAKIATLARNDGVEALRQLANADLPARTKSSLLALIQKNRDPVWSCAATGRIIHEEIDSASHAQRVGYLELLEMLNYEDDVKSVEPAPQLQPQTELVPQPGSQLEPQSEPQKTPPRKLSPLRGSPPLHSLVYVDSSGSENDSMVSTASTASSVSSHHIGTSSSKLGSGDFILPFPGSSSDCKTVIAAMVESVKTGEASVDNLAALAVLVTAVSAGSLSSRSPLSTAVDVWRKHFTYDMQLRDSILPFLTQPRNNLNVDRVIVALVLLRSLLNCDAPHAAVYLDTIACCRALCVVSSNCGHLSVEIDEHLLPDLAKTVLASCTDLHKVLDLLYNTSLTEEGAQTASKSFSLRSAAVALDAAPPAAVLDADERAILHSMVSTGISDNDARVRKEVYPLLMAVHRRNNDHATEIAAALSDGQRQLFNYYLENDAI